MIRTSVAAASALGSAALAVAALTSPMSAATPIAASVPAVATASALIHQTHKHGHLVTTFDMVRSGASVAANCLTHAKAKVEIISKGPVEVMNVTATGLPKRTDFDFFVIQVPDTPFGLSWYQGDLESNKHGRAHGTFIGRFSEETFIVAPNVAPAPVKHPADASSNPATPPVHEFHLGFWFNSPKDAAAAGCNSAVTPFNGEHNAGVQAMSTRQFGPLDGPLGHIPS